MGWGWWSDLIVIDTDEDGHWPASWNIAWALLVILFFFNSLYALLLLYHEHDRWCRLRQARKWTYLVLETFRRLDSRNGSSLVDSPIAISYRFWPCYVRERRRIRVLSATLWNGVTGCKIASTTQGTLKVRMAKATRPDVLKSSVVFSLEASEIARYTNQHVFTILITIAKVLISSSSTSNLRLDLLLVSDNAAACSSSPSSTTLTNDEEEPKGHWSSFSTLSDNHVLHQLTLC